MTDADALLRAGDLTGARSALVEVVRSRPSDTQARMFLFQLLAVAGEWDKAKKQLQAMAQLSPEAQMLSVAYGQAIDGEAVRAEVFGGKKRIDVLANPDGWAGQLVDAIELIAKSDLEAGTAARDAAFDAAPDSSGMFNGKAFDWISDADGRFGPAFEVIIAGRYGLVPFDAVEKIKCEGTRDLRDLVWLPIQLGMKSGQSIAAFLPSRYPDSEKSSDTAEQLARTTSWHATDWGEAGRGQRLWTLSDGEDYGILSLKTLEFG